MFNRHHFTARRLALGLSVEELADELQVAPSTVYRWESGSTCPSLRVLIAASRILCVPLLALIEDDGSEDRRIAVALDSILRLDMHKEIEA
ncbi:helix-turn-helix transcriptional regulator [Streptomyces sp. DT2A-34]|uniref:helix-turn-helix domain-containing protein n=1 Tax=Streptomyces sp. DT2A-34 TaxID=3051182 RepID=UPI00265BF497|nr:helix-turn-helix transcriptional regulator [Streptomyces sp. DT2A-34]MDO0914400.1 helix-turn-helix transcriptional regulator [Streptomyces sp. DT2A-34]